VFTILMSLQVERLFFLQAQNIKIGLSIKLSMSGFFYTDRIKREAPNRTNSNLSDRSTTCKF